MSSSSLSSLSPPPSSSDEEPPPQLSRPSKTLKLSKGKLTAANAKDEEPSSRESSPVREPTPEHEYVLADNPSIPAIVMFRARFSDAFPKSVPNLGPQDLEQGVVEGTPSESVDHLLCALLGLVLNRKKYVERGHFGRALEEALHTNKNQWPKAWKGESPLHGGKSFQTMNPTERLDLLQTLVVWSLSSSEVISAMVKEAYKQSRQEDDRNQPLSVQPWGMDGRKRKYWLVEGQVDTSFRLYLQIPAKRKTDAERWWSVAGTIDELKSVAEDLRTEGSQAARRLADKFLSAVPRLEESEEKRKRREYRQARKAAFSRPEPGFSLYEGRTRGKRMKYTFSDDEDEGFESSSVRRSTRQSGVSTPAEPAGPTVTASGRQVRSRFGRSYGETVTAEEQEQRSKLSLGSELDGDSASDVVLRRDGRPRRSGNKSNRRTVNGLDSDEDMDDHDSDPSGEEWDGDDHDILGKFDNDLDEDMSDASEESFEDNTPKSLIVTLRYRNLDRAGNVETEKQQNTPEPTEPKFPSTVSTKMEPIDSGTDPVQETSVLAPAPNQPQSHPVYQNAHQPLPSKLPSIASMLSSHDAAPPITHPLPFTPPPAQNTFPSSPPLTSHANEREPPRLDQQQNGYHIYPPPAYAAPLPTPAGEAYFSTSSEPKNVDIVSPTTAQTFGLSQRPPQPPLVSPPAQTSNGWR